MEPARTLLERRKQDTVRDIAATAIALIDRDGFENTTVEDVAAAVGCSPRTIYRYFGTKEDLVFHDLPDVITGLGDELHARLEAGEEEWSAVTEALVEFITRFDLTNAKA